MSPPIPSFDPSARWIWTSEHRRNHYALFVKDIDLPPEVGTLRIRITASYHYELFVDGRFINRGPLHGDPRWCHYDEIEAPVSGSAAQVAIVAHHSTGTYLHYVTPAPPGVLAEIRAGDRITGTDDTWSCATLRMWREEVAAKGWALGYCEDYDARVEPAGWQAMGFPAAASWNRTRIVHDAHEIWGGYTERGIPLMGRRPVEPVAVRAWSAPEDGPDAVFEISQRHDEEHLVPHGGWKAYSLEGLNDLLTRSGAFTLDLARERVGFTSFDVEAPAGAIIEISGAELLQDGRPWVFRKNTCYSMRYTCRAGRQRFTSFSWNGFRYMHVVLRGKRRAEVRFHGVGCVERTAGLSALPRQRLADPRLEAILDLCRYTLEVGAQELLIDCPTREQAPAWADSVFIAQGIWKAFGEHSYLQWYLEAFIRAPLNGHGLLAGRYPGTRGIWLDFCLIPLLGQAFYRAETGCFYEPQRTLERGREIKKWFDARRDADGLVAFDFRDYYARGLRTFIDHPGLGMHDSAHPGIDRDGTSCGLNAFYYGYVRVLADIAREAGDGAEADRLKTQAEHLAESIRSGFSDGEMFHDTNDRGRLSPGTSWQTNGLVVYFDIARGDTARRAMKRMIAGYDILCRCTPYTYVYFLTALRKVGMEEQAMQLIKREWGAMLDRGATTTWEGFLGDAKDSLCHPFSTAPLLFLLR